MRSRRAVTYFNSLGLTRQRLNVSREKPKGLLERPRRDLLRSTVEAPLGRRSLPSSAGRAFGGAITCSPSGHRRRSGDGTVVAGGSHPRHFEAARTPHHFGRLTIASQPSAITKTITRTKPKTTTPTSPPPVSGCPIRRTDPALMGKKYSSLGRSSARLETSWRPRRQGVTEPAAALKLGF